MKRLDRTGGTGHALRRRPASGSGVVARLPSLLRALSTAALLLVVWSFAWLLQAPAVASELAWPRWVLIVACGLIFAVAAVGVLTDPAASSAERRGRRAPGARGDPQAPESTSEGLNGTTSRRSAIR